MRGVVVPALGNNVRVEVSPDFGWIRYQGTADALVQCGAATEEMVRSAKTGCRRTCPNGWRFHRSARKLRGSGFITITIVRHAPSKELLLQMPGATYAARSIPGFLICSALSFIGYRVELVAPYRVEALRELIEDCRTLTESAAAFSQVVELGTRLGYLNRPRHGVPVDNSKERDLVEAWAKQMALLVQTHGENETLKAIASDAQLALDRCSKDLQPGLQDLPVILR